MTTRRARKHKNLVNFEKKLHHRAGIHLQQHRKIRIHNLTHAVCVESAYEWHDQKQYSELAQNLYKTGPVSVDFSLNPEFAQKLWEALKDD